MMQPFTLRDAAEMTGAAPMASALTYTGVSTDTRTIQPGDLFVALRGEQFDGNAYVQQAIDAGAVAAVVDEIQDGVAAPQLKVEDTLKALGCLALGNRLASPARCVGVTGSSGKTTVKEMLAAILRQEGDTLATRGNLNNHIGVPLTLFCLEPAHRYAIIEMGASGVGEIAYTVNLARPEVAVLTNAGEAHLEGFGSYENIVEAKGEIIDGVASDGVVVLNGDDPACPVWRARAGQRRVLTVSADAAGDADYHYRNVRSENGQTVFDAVGPTGWSQQIRLNLPGKHNLLNALMAIAATRALGARDESIVEGLDELKPVKGRLEKIALQSGVNIVDDSYNANPTSMKAALQHLAEQGGTGAAVLGRMAELGPDAERLHEEIGHLAARLGIAHLLVVGPGTEGYVRGFGAGAQQFASHEAAADWLLAHSTPPMTIMVKGSRSSAMDLVVRALIDKVNN
ncbi:UDP-N-acetylmuramoyl-tripeptide--D-alanyl-D-alanine ligase [Marinobacter nanhaiticus D15-8W]|uniref:UDP-N-acetylmuramoyl-tripeptide--D-alanyl-D-alanine ligase n=1 Tax=Marinobacter nanhaiticus D15-8W TaxID=626887 RepID=N6W2U7_9GAMM|nr:UDP-N-acetylmuramoyl-tripeptide--D-alanyl-D-alanine ligase [Marinobacter nanhaiticus]ENO16865.1 UDP-N-acetylmuramoyl-tripeptide--D-alanyl-D-alanine ligase [Marinobacter nanhaiticus D15-8W]BES72682.1 UDP-N-acetylmuramoyl-tripeptide--D-alanyl-D-alanine ligase [Marinobacter nanhaiticus D15-8W]